MTQLPRIETSGLGQGRRVMFGVYLAGAWLVAGCGGLDSGAASDGGPMPGDAAVVMDASADDGMPLPLGRSSGPPNVIIIFTDDQGYADVSVHGVASDVRTPYIDSIATHGARMTAGYVTGPQCTPSRAGLLTGRYQQRFGVDDLRFSPLPLGERTLADRLREAGYATGIVGKWHLDVAESSAEWLKAHYPGLAVDNVSLGELPLADRKPYYPESRGFDDVFVGYTEVYWRNFTREGNSIPLAYQRFDDYRIDVKSEAAAAFIDRHHREPFLLYLAYFAPHVPLEAPEAYLSRFPGDMPQRRRHALAMLSAIDDGVGSLLARLDGYGLIDNTLVFFMSDNGAPLAIDKEDFPIGQDGPIWNGSLNEPWVGEKGLLSEAGIRVPFLFQWPAKVSPGIVFDVPVISLDVARTALTAAGVADQQGLDGSDLVAAIAGDTDLSERALYWRFWNQAALRRGKWKYLQLREHSDYLFDLSGADADAEGTNVIEQHPDQAAAMRAELTLWAQDHLRPGLSVPTAGSTETLWYDHYFPP